MLKLSQDPGRTLVMAKIYNFLEAGRNKIGDSRFGVSVPAGGTKKIAGGMDKNLSQTQSNQN